MNKPALKPWMLVVDSKGHVWELTSYPIPHEDNWTIMARFAKDDPTTMREINCQEFLNEDAIPRVVI